MVVVDDLDKRLDAAALLDLLGTHATGHLGRVSLNTGDESVGERMSLGAGVLGLDDDDLLDVHMLIECARRTGKEILIARTAEMSCLVRFASIRVCEYAKNRVHTPHIHSILSSIHIILPTNPCFSIGTAISIS